MSHCEKGNAFYSKHVSVYFSIFPFYSCAFNKPTFVLKKRHRSFQPYYDQHYLSTHVTHMQKKIKHDNASFSVNARK